MLEKIEAVDVPDFNERYSFSQTIQMTKDDLIAGIERGSLHYVWLPACPRANRITSVLKSYHLDEWIHEYRLSPYYKLGENWVFSTANEIFEATSIQDYFPKKIQASQPFLYDQAERRVLSNDTYHMSTLLAEFADERKNLTPIQSLFPTPHREMLRKWNAWLYEHVNFKIYQVAAKNGSEKIQGIEELEATYDLLDNYLAEHDYLYAAQLTESDFRLFHNLIRHEIYVQQFAVFTRTLAEFPFLKKYVQHLITKYPQILDDLYFDEILKTHFRSENNVKKYGFMQTIPTKQEIFPFLVK